MKKTFLLIISLSFLLVGCLNKDLSDDYEKQIERLNSEVAYKDSKIELYENLTGTLISIFEKQTCEKDILLYINSKIDMSELEYDYDKDYEYYVVYEYKNVYPFIIKVSKEINSSLDENQYYMFSVNSIDNYIYEEYSNQMLFKKMDIVSLRNIKKDELNTYHPLSQEIICK